jgi:thiamine pyrophosphokinase
MVALILADGDVPARARLDTAWPGWDEGVDLVIAADGGARHASRLGITLDLWVGDGDSLGDEGISELAAAGVPIERSRADKDQTDLELAVDAALARGAHSLVIVGALGGERLDHALTNVALLARADLAAVSVVLLDGTARLSLVRAPDPTGAPTTVVLPGEPGTTVSLLPVGGDVTGVTTDGLVYPLDDEPLLLGSARGVSNVVALSGASVTVRHGFLLVVGSPATL